MSTNSGISQNRANGTAAGNLGQQDFRYFTTPIYYASGQPHSGHLYTTVLSQILKHHNEAAGRTVKILTGMDEHGEKIAEKARQAGVDPQKFVDGLKEKWLSTWASFGLSFDIFLRTTSPEHIQTVQEILRRVHAKGDIYFGEHEGHYCIDCEAFLTDKEMDSDKKCLVHGVATEVRKEGNYYFRTTKYKEDLKRLIASGELVKSKRYAAELMSMAENLDSDLSISRPKSRTSWGIELPFDRDHVAYVWFDALPNYVTGVGGVDAAAKSPYWRSAKHLIGKDILRFHGIYWPAVLLSLGLPIPELLVHGWLLLSGEKMSKSKGNVLTIEAVQTLGKDAFVNTVFRLINPGDDLECSEALIAERYNADLANGVGNLLSRTLGLASRTFGKNYPVLHAADLGPDENRLCADALRAVDEVYEALESYKTADALKSIWGIVSSTDKYLTTWKPWELIRIDPCVDPASAAKLRVVLGTACAMIRVVGLLSYPFFPEKMSELLMCLGEDLSDRSDFYTRARQLFPVDQARHLGQSPKLFPRNETVFDTRRAPAPEAEAAASIPRALGKPAIPFSLFDKVDILVGLVEKAELVDGSDKLLRVEVSLGAYGSRQIFSGIREWVKPEDLAGRKVLVAANLEPRKMRFGVSEGMLLSTESAAGQVQLVQVADSIEPGSRLS